ncbi:unnamed protein product [Effrenium voratum]|nr:unnamed protein product [Effrenium voratum]
MHIFHDRYQWSDWEHGTFTHCGVVLRENEDLSVTLDHSKFVESLEPAIFEARDDDSPVTEKERSQLRGLLGALQWRCYNTAPQHAARLSLIQSEVNTATIATVKAMNKLLREVQQQRQISVKVNALHCPAEDVEFYGWCDAAVGNRKDYGSTGGYVIAATTPGMDNGENSPLTIADLARLDGEGLDESGPSGGLRQPVQTFPSPNADLQVREGGGPFPGDEHPQLQGDREHCEPEDHRRRVRFLEKGGGRRQQVHLGEPRQRLAASAWDLAGMLPGYLEKDGQSRAGDMKEGLFLFDQALQDQTKELGIAEEEIEGLLSADYLQQWMHKNLVERTTEVSLTTFKEALKMAEFTLPFSSVEALWYSADKAVISGGKERASLRQVRDLEDRLVMYLTNGMFYESVRNLIVNELHVPSLQSLDAKERSRRPSSRWTRRRAIAASLTPTR